MINFGKTTVALGSVGSRVAVTGAASFGTTGSDLGTEFSSSILEGLVNTDSDKELYDLYREIYMMDTVSGPAVDIMASLPWSDCSLMGVDDTKQLQVYEDTLGELGLTSTMTALSTAYLVLGKAIGSLLFDSERGIFTDIITHNPDMCEITPIPLRGYDPKIDLRLDQEFKKFLASKDPRDVEARKEISPQLMQKLKSGKIELEPLSTLYIQRAVIPGIDSMSYYTRVLPIWLIEKALMRGTIIGAWRRQRSILHVMCLTGDTLVPVNGRLTRMDSIIDSNVCNPGDSIDVDFKTKGKDGSIVRVKRAIYQGKKTVKRVVTKSGYSIKGTGNHKLLTLGPNATVQWSPIDSIRRGDYLCMDANICNRSVRKPLSLNIKERSWKKTPVLYDVPLVMTPDLAYLIGLILSDGTIRDYSILIGNTEISILNRASEAFEAVFGITPSIRLVEKAGSRLYTKDFYELSVNSRHIIDMLDQIGVSPNWKLQAKNDIRKVSNKKDIPWSILRADTESKYAFIAGYIDGDGFILKDYTKSLEIVITSMSHTMLHNMQIMLLDMGIKSTVFNNRLIFNRADACRSYDKLKHLLYHPSKLFEDLEDTLDRYRGLPVSSFLPDLQSRFVRQGGERRQYTFLNDDGDEVIVPYWGTLMDTYLHNKSLSYAKYRQGAYDNLLHAISLISKKIYNNIVNLMSLQYVFEPVTSIRTLKGKHKVYDLSIDTSDGSAPAFVANGFIAHNCGDEDWEPTDEQLAMFTQLFQNADRDPQGAVVTTRNGVQVQEVRQGNDFWKISDEWDIFANAKMRALGISEAFLSGEATYSNAEVALSVFMENLRTFRDTMTSAILYDKIFLLLAKYHGFKTRTKAEINNRLRLSDSERNRDPYGRKRQAGMYASRNLAEAAQYNIPTVHWSKELKAVGDSSVLELLRSAQENNIPIPLAMIATACGVSLSAVIDSFEEDVEQRRIIKKHVQTLHKEGLDNLTADSEGDGGDGGSDYERGGMDSMFGSTIPSPNKSPVVLATNKSGNPKFDTILGNLVQSLPPDIIMSKEKARKVLNYAFKLSRQARKNGAANRIF